MFSSKKVLKIGDNTVPAVQDYSMQTFPEQDREDGDGPSTVSVRTTRTDHLRLEAEHTLVQARQEAKQIIASARDKAAAIAAEARAQGQTEGRALGEQQARAEFADALQLLRAVPDAFDQLQQQFYEEHQDVLVQLALQVARKIIHREIETTDDVVLGIVRNAVQLAVIREKLQVRVHPDDLAACRSHTAAILAYGEIDARIDQQFEAVARELQRPDSGPARTAQQ